ncbi:uncharacterized protein [Dendrobates tinctorius]|uniref:uncharacterized protein n=1 Tax=Dendrobates tinctorius TaxID=92724 RepID=UPI003CCA34FA
MAALLVRLRRRSVTLSPPPPASSVYSSHFFPGCCRSASPPAAPAPIGRGESRASKSIGRIPAPLLWTRPHYSFSGALVRGGVGESLRAPGVAGGETQEDSEGVTFSAPDLEPLGQRAGLLGGRLSALDGLGHVTAGRREEPEGGQPESTRSSEQRVQGTGQVAAACRGEARTPVQRTNPGGLCRETASCEYVRPEPTATRETVTPVHSPCTCGVGAEPLTPVEGLIETHSTIPVERLLVLKHRLRAGDPECLVFPLPFFINLRDPCCGSIKTAECTATRETSAAADGADAGEDDPTSKYLAD